MTNSICNLFGYSAAAAYDRAFGTRNLDGIQERFTSGLLHEFQLADGELQPVVSDWTGLTLIFKPTLVSAASNVILLNTFDPAMAQRTWATLRHEQLSVAADGRLSVATLTPQDKLDVGNYRLGSSAFTMASVANPAHEMGNETIAAAALAEIDASHNRIQSTETLVYEGVRYWCRPTSSWREYYVATTGEIRWWRAPVKRPCAVHCSPNARIRTFWCLPREAPMVVASHWSSDQPPVPVHRRNSASTGCGRVRHTACPEQTRPRSLLITTDLQYSQSGCPAAPR